MDSLFFEQFDLPIKCFICSFFWNTSCPYFKIWVCPASPTTTQPPHIVSQGVAWSRGPTLHPGPSTGHTGQQKSLQAHHQHDHDRLQGFGGVTPKDLHPTSCVLIGVCMAMALDPWSQQWILPANVIWKRPHKIKNACDKYVVDFAHTFASETRQWTCKDCLRIECVQFVCPCFAFHFASNLVEDACVSEGAVICEREYKT